MKSKKRIQYLLIEVLPIRVLHPNEYNLFVKYILFKDYKTYLSVTWDNKVHMDQHPVHTRFYYGMKNKRRVLKTYNKEDLIVYFPEIFL